VAFKGDNYKRIQQKITATKSKTVFEETTFKITVDGSTEIT